MSYQNVIQMPDPRIKPGICGAEFETRTGLWVCIKKPHAKTYYRHHRSGEMIFSDNPSVDRHHFVKKLNHSVED